MIGVRSRRIGRFIANAESLGAAIDSVTIDAAAEFNAVFRSVVIVEANYRFDLHAVEYIGFSDQFDQIEHGETAPLYHVEISRESSQVGGMTIVTFDAKFTRQEGVYRGR